MEDVLKKGKKMPIRVVEMAAYSSPRIVEKRNRDWVSYGDDNQYYQYLIDLYHTSPTNNAAIQGISDMIYGKGLHATESNPDLEAYVNFKKIFQEEDVRRVCHDLKLFGHAAFQVCFEEGRVVAAYHIPRQSIRPAKCNEDGDVETYYFSDDWSDSDKPNFNPTPYPAFGFEGPNDTDAILSIDSYSAGSVYFTPVDYQGGLQYAELEGEIANFHLNNIKNGLNPSQIVNFNNGIPTEEEQFEIENDVKAKWSGSSNAGRFIIAFNDGPENKATIESVQLSDAHNQYQFLSTECMTKIMVAHRITSPMLFGIKDQSGLGNNAEELEKASVLFTHSVARPFQRQIEEAVEKVLASMDLSLDVAFEQATPFASAVADVDRSFTGIQITSAVQIVEKVRNHEITKEQGVQLLISMLGYTEQDAEAMFEEQITLSKDMTDQDEKYWLEWLDDKGEVTDPALWELVTEDKVTDYDKPDEDFVQLFKRFAEPEKKSEDDAGIYRVRYAYWPPRETTRKGQVVSRIFCRNMVRNALNKVEYRREDIDKMSRQGVNSEFAKAGSSSYDIFRFKGGLHCHHAWVRRVYRRKRTSDGKFIPLQPNEKGTTDRDLKNYTGVSPATAREAGVPNSKLEPAGWDRASKTEISIERGG